MSMKTNYVPAIVMLVAGAVYCLLGLMSGASLYEFMVHLLIVLLIFYVLGGIIRMVLDRFMGELGTKEEESSEEEVLDENVPQEEAETTSEEEEM